ncbi:MAG: pyruvate formate-lyase-activating protein [Anaerovoracaceae bacterium]
MKGYVHSIESMGLVDGPGVRTVIFLQGCNLRCIYCHNPDTWKLNEGELLDVSEIIKKVLRYKPYYKDTGGVTISGGEPLLQKEFLIELLKGLKENGIHTCIDTAGVGASGYEEILKYVDLIIYDIKHFDEEGYKYITKRNNSETLNFLETATKMNIPMWVRHVVVPGITDSEEHIAKLSEYVKTLSNVVKVELLPYHLLGKNKYEAMDMKYPLEGVSAMDKEVTKKLQDKYFI